MHARNLASTWDVSVGGQEPEGLWKHSPTGDFSGQSFSRDCFIKLRALQAAAAVARDAGHHACLPPSSSTASFSLLIKLNLID